MTNAMPGIRNKVLVFVLAAMMVFGLMAAIGAPAAQAQDYYFFTLEDGVYVPTPMGHGCVYDYYYSGGNVTLILQNETYGSVTGYISSFIVNSVQCYDPDTNTATYPAVYGVPVAAEIKVTFINPPPGMPPHADITCYAIVPS